MNVRTTLIVAATMGFLAVALGAFGAHGLKDFLAAQADGAQRRAWWETATQYLMWHALFLVGVTAIRRHLDLRPLALASIAVVVGALLFSGSLYVMTLTGIKALGAVTPLGGLAFLTAWAMVIVSALRSPTSAG